MLFLEYNPKMQYLPVRKRKNGWMITDRYEEPSNLRGRSQCVGIESLA